MPFIEHDLKTLLADMPSPFVQSEVKTIMLQLLSAVDFCHANWIVSFPSPISEICIKLEPTSQLTAITNPAVDPAVGHRSGRDCVSSPASA